MLCNTILIIPVVAKIFLKCMHYCHHKKGVDCALTTITWLHNLSTLVKQWSATVSNQET